MIRQILTHPGGAHKDDFLACCVLIHLHGVSVVRREPTDADLADLEMCVVDVGGEHAPERNNFDHHQFPRESPPLCALSLVLQNLDVYEDAKAFCDWLQPAEWLDCLGPNETARKMNISREALTQLMSPIDVTLLRRFAAVTELTDTDPIWQVMRMVGEDLLNYLKSLRARLTEIGEHAEWWTLSDSPEKLEALFIPRTEPMPDEPGFGLGRYIEEQGKGASVIAMVYPDRRGDGYGISRFNDDQRMDLTRVTDEDDVHFAHARGFVAKTSATDPERLKNLLLQSFASE
ncbi:MAG: hypothetical protein ACI9R3_000071 [Verrucomicrobiales bacterium]|jgi:hypothetical protein